MKRTIFGGLFMIILTAGRAQSWTRIDAIPKSDVYCLELHNNTLYAGTTNRIYVSTDNGVNWITSSNLGAVGDIETITEYHHKIFAGTYGGGVFVSSNGGHNWMPVNDGISFFPYITKFTIWKDRLYAGTAGEGFFQFDESANRWSYFNMGFYTNVDGTIADMTVHNNVLLAGAGANGLFYKYDTAAASWTSTHYIAGGGFSVGMMASHLLSDGSHLLVTAQPSVVPVLQSNDGGNNWISDANGIQLRGYGVFAMSTQQHYVAINAFDGAHNFVKLYQRDRTAPAGTSWGTPENISFTLFFYGMAFSNNRLYAATDSGLYYKGPLLVPPTPRVDSANGWALFPNPAGSQTSIVFSLPAREDITIRILDAAGKLVSIPYQHYRVDTGVRVVPLYTGGMAAGVYFINTSFGGKPRTLRLVVGH